jgi:hypothetical protein
LKITDKIKKAIAPEKNDKLSRIDSMLEHESIKSKCTRDQIEGAIRYYEAFDREEKLRRQEDKRRVVIKWIGYFLAFVSVNGSFFILADKTGIVELLYNKWSIWPTLAGFLLTALYYGNAVLLIIIFFWLLNVTGFRFWIEDWNGAWDNCYISESHNILKFKEFPRRERIPLVRNLNKGLKILSYGLKYFEREAIDNKDIKLSTNVRSIYKYIGPLTQASSSFLSLGLLKECPSWNTFTLTLVETAENLKAESSKTSKYCKKAKMLIDLASLITSKVLSVIIDIDNRNESKETLSQIIQVISSRSKAK